ERSLLAPDIPTFNESGLPGLEFTTWFGVYTPAGVAAEHRERLHEAFVSAVQNPDVAQQLQAMVVTPAPPHTPGEFASLVDADSERWKKVIEDSNVSIV